MDEAERLRVIAQAADGLNVTGGKDMRRAAGHMDRMAEALRKIAGGRERHLPDGTTEVVDLDNAAEIARAALIDAGYEVK